MTSNLNKKQLLTILVIVITTIVIGAWIMYGDKAKSGATAVATDTHGGGKGHADEGQHDKKSTDKHDDHKDHADGEHHEEEGPAKGPHGGKLLVDGAVSIEVVVSEDAGAPRFLVYPLRDNKPLAINAVNVTASLTRPGTQPVELTFAPEKDYLKSAQSVAEPHVFDATFAVQSGGEPFLFTMSEAEGKVALTDAQVKAAGVTIRTAEAGTINSSLVLPGEIHFNEDRTAHVVPRVAGVVQKVSAQLGQQVKKGQVLAVIASTTLAQQRSELQTAQTRFSMAKLTFEREKKLWQEKISAEQDYLQAQQAMQEAQIAVQSASGQLAALGASAGSGNGALNGLELRAPFDGVVVEKHITQGEAVKEDANVFTISDLSSVWAEIAVPAKDIASIRVGEKVTVKTSAFGSTATGTIAYVGSLLGEQTRTAKARVTLANPQGAWRPGLAVNVEVVSGTAKAGVTVVPEAIQIVDEKSVVFTQVEGGFLPQEVQTGRADKQAVEIVKGITAGTPYAATGSFVIKSELGKASAEHVH